ncbi:XkdX family protein [Furfurilactobacillus milii]|uniref:XkdX family protein n=1 Tax=Furfurilactobacillus rossiae TaxID=231049 RepID=A0A7C9IZP2_9LACO|nr:XkdX family protein [Furfurilactobacillus milii]MYV04457.1 XkdX family protein [Furfurilactobacillus milii]
MDLFSMLKIFKTWGATDDYFKSYLTMGAITQAQYDELTKG